MYNPHVEIDRLETILSNWFDEPQGEIVAGKNSKISSTLMNISAAMVGDDCWD